MKLDIGDSFVGRSTASASTHSSRKSGLEGDRRERELVRRGSRSAPGRAERRALAAVGLVAAALVGVGCEPIPSGVGAGDPFANPFLAPTECWALELSDFEAETCWTSGYPRTPAY